MQNTVYRQPINVINPLQSLNQLIVDCLLKSAFALFEYFTLILGKQS